jgi:hypothetical protein
MSQYAKAIVAIISAALVAAIEALPEYESELQIAVALLGAIGVYLVPNAPPEPEQPPSP